MKYVAGLMFSLLVFVAGCNQAGETNAKAPAGGSGAAADTGAAAASQADDEHADEQATGHIDSLAGTQLSLDDGSEIVVLSVAKFDQSQDTLAGPVAIEGRVSECFPERGALVLVDTDNMADCSDSCCPQAQVPVKVNLADYSGALPVAGQQVVVVGDITRTGLGFELAVVEIRCGGETVLERAAAQA